MQNKYPQTLKKIKIILYPLALRVFNPAYFICHHLQPENKATSYSTQLHGDRIDHFTQLQGDRIDHATQLLSAVIDHITQLLSAMIDHVT